MKTVAIICRREQTNSLLRRRGIAAGILRILLAAFCCLCCGIASAEDDADRDLAVSAKAPKEAEDLDDVQDLLFLGPSRPALIRLHVKINGQPFRKQWRDNIHKLFVVADANRDAAVDLVEPPQPADAETRPKFAEIDVFANSAAAYLGQDAAQSRTALRQLATEQGGQVSEPVLMAYFERMAPPFAIVARAEQRTYTRGMAPAPALFPLLDANGDQMLSKAELAAAEERLANRDFNEDEVVSPRELMVAPDASLSAAAAVAEQSQTDGQPTLPGVGPLYLLAPGEQPLHVADLLLERYDGDDDQQLSAAEMDLDDERRGRLDTNGDSKLSRDELARFAALGPDVEMTNVIGRGSYVPSAQRKKLARVSSADHRLSVDALRHGGFELSLADASISVRINQRDPSQNNADGPELRNFDADGNGYLSADELKNNPELLAAFGVLDLDGDGKLFADEFQAFTDRQNRAAASRLVLEVTDGGQQLLGVLDTSPDSVLSLRELRSADAALERSDSNHDGRLSGNEIPRRVKIDLSRNTLAGARAVNARPMAEDRDGRETPPAGPAWFQKLDRNRDGDLSAREFVGPEEVFVRLDADRDGLIDAAEAEAAGK